MPVMLIVPLLFRAPEVEGLVPAIGSMQLLPIVTVRVEALVIVTEFQVTVPQVRVLSPRASGSVKSMPLGSKFALLVRLPARLKVVIPEGKVPPLRIKSPVVMEAPVIVRTAPAFCV